MAELSTGDKLAGIESDFQSAAEVYYSIAVARVKDVCGTFWLAVAKLAHTYTYNLAVSGLSLFILYSLRFDGGPSRI